jgi:phenylpropionate dioxygenase-like ring-hydroxylating dioxygenase large terminal subunit
MSIALHDEITAPERSSRSVATNEDFDRALRRGWFAVAHSKDLAAPVKTRILDVELVVFRDEKGQARVASNQCPHRGAALSMGQVVGDGIQCAYHGWQWHGETGRCLHIPAIGPNGAIPPAARLKTYHAHERYGLVWTTLSEDPVGEIPQFEEIDAIDFDSGWVSGAPWDVSCNACAAIENFRDVAHFPFVHRKTMGVLPHEIEPLKAVRKGFHAYLERIESPYQENTSDPIWAATHPGTVRITYHAIAPSVVSIVMDTAEAGKRAIVFAVVPTSLESSRWFFTEAITADVPMSAEEVLEFGRSITDEDVALIEHIRPRGFDGMLDQVHCVADAFTLKYRDAFMSFVREAAASE